MCWMLPPLPNVRNGSYPDGPLLAENSGFRSIWQGSPFLIRHPEPFDGAQGGPGSVSVAAPDPSGPAARWMLKRVQHDETGTIRFPPNLGCLAQPIRARTGLSGNGSLADLPTPIPSSSSSPPLSSSPRKRGPSRLHRRVLLEPYEPPDAVLACEAGYRALAVLLDALDEAGGYAGLRADRPWVGTRAAPQELTGFPLSRE